MVDSRQTGATGLIDLDGRTVSARALSDPDVHRVEMDRIFAHEWSFVAHETEIAGSGDYVSRYIGADPVIVARAADGQIHVSLNSCSHRGMAVCRADSGRARTFQCPYHGWTYRNTGELVAVTAEEDAYGTVDREVFRLKPARVGTYHGLVFATFDPAASNLEDHLGPITWYLDLVFGLTDEGTEALGPPQRWIVEADWKLAADNFSADGYHAPLTHGSLRQVGLLPASYGRDTFQGINVCDPARGHGLRCLDNTGRPGTFEGACEAMGITGALVEEARRRITPNQMQVFLGQRPLVGNMFPNFAWLNNGRPTAPGGPIDPCLTIRVWRPIGPGRMEIWVWALAPKAASDEIKDRARRGVIRTFSSSGVFEQDDAETWVGIQRAVAGPVGRERRLTYLSTIPCDPDALAGPAELEVRPGFAAEDNQWNFYRRWHQLVGDHVS